MNQLRSDARALSLRPVMSDPASPTTSEPRLVVIIREVHGEALLAGRIHELARARGLPVTLLGIARDPAVEAGLRRGLVTIAAFLEEASRYAERPQIQIKCGRDWLNHIAALLRPGDLLACYADGRSSVFERPLSDALSRALNVPVYTFEGPDAERTPQNRLTQLASWTSSLACIGAFLLLQARIVVAVQGWLQSVLMLLTLGAEVGSLWLVNSMSGQL